MGAFFTAWFLATISVAVAPDDFLLSSPAIFVNYTAPPQITETTDLFPSVSTYPLLPQETSPSNQSQNCPLAAFPTKEQNVTISPRGLDSVTRTMELSSQKPFFVLDESGTILLDFSVCRNNSYECSYDIRVNNSTFEVKSTSSDPLGMLNCSWRILSPQQFSLYVEFKEYQLTRNDICGDSSQEQFKISDTYDGVNLIKSCDEDTGLPHPVISLKNQLVFNYYHSNQTTKEAPRIRFRLTTLDESFWRRNLHTVYTTNETGYVESYGYDRERKYPNNVQASVNLTFPSQYVIMISFVSFDLEYSSSCSFDYLNLSQTESNITKIFCGIKVIDTEIYNKSLNLFFKTDRSDGGGGFRMLFSIHPVSQMPQRVELDQFNCSVPFYRKFERHLKCNLATECTSGEDEQNCPFSKKSRDCKVGLIDVGNKCVSYRNFPKNITWNEAHNACLKDGQTLVTMKTEKEWWTLQNLVTFAKKSTVLFVGLSTAHSTLSSMYQNVLQWADRTMAYYVPKGFRTINVPSCFYFKAGWTDSLSYGSCNEKQNAHYLCEKRKPIKNNKLQFPSNVKDQPVNLDLVNCIIGHVTLDFLKCDIQSKCGSKDFYKSCEITSSGVSVPMFSCDYTAETIPYSLVCDLRTDCADGSDEKFCVFPSCEGFKCRNHQCIDLSKYCDGVQHCADNSDEYCVTAVIQNLQSVPSPSIVHLTGSGDYSITAMNVTDLCPDTHFRCPDNGYCLPVYVRCNSVSDCPGREDETNCRNYNCDGVFQCPQHDDETFCHIVCPKDCKCHGFAFVCFKRFEVTNYADLRYVDASGTDMVPADFSKMPYLSSLILARCGLRKFSSNISLSNLRILDLSYNYLSLLDMNEFESLTNLRELHLTGNPLASLFGSISSWKLKHFKILDLSRTNIVAYNGTVFDCCPQLEVLNLSNSQLNTISEEGFAMTPSLRKLDLNGCWLKSFPIEMFKNLSKLRYASAENFKLCCQENLPESLIEGKCIAPRDELSSCEDLLQSHWFRAFLWIFAALAILGNGGSFVVRNVLHGRTANQASYNVFVSNLCFADLLMGIYLAIIGSADQVYRGKYLWYDEEWKGSATCKVAGFLSLLSNEVSAFMICLITLDRFLVLRFPFSTVRFTSRSAAIACSIAWIVGVVLAAIPLLPMTSDWDFYSQTGICIPLPITRKSFKGQGYSFGVFIVLNFILFLLIAVGQVIIYISVRANSMSTVTKKTSRDLTIARRLMTIVLSDFLCWFPIGLMGLLVARGTPIPGEVSVAMAIFVLPFNSALNPFLYTFNILIEKRRKAVETRMMESLEARLTSEIISRQEMPVYKISAPVSKQAALRQIMMWLDTDVVSPDAVVKCIRERQAQQERDVGSPSVNSQPLRKADAMEIIRAWLHTQLLTSGEVVSLGMDWRTQIP